MSEYSIISKISYIEFILVCLLALNFLLFFLFYSQEKLKKIEKEINRMFNDINISMKEIIENLYFVMNKIGIDKFNLEKEIEKMKEEKILELHKNGLSYNEISQKLNVSPSLVEFVIKINKFKKTI